jgi:hypothetical protein
MATVAAGPAAVTRGALETFMELDAAIAPEALETMGPEALEAMAPAGLEAIAAAGLDAIATAGLVATAPAGLDAAVDIAAILATGTGSRGATIAGSVRFVTTDGGNDSSNRAPAPNSLWTSISPPCSRTIP